MRRIRAALACRPLTDFAYGDCCLFDARGEALERVSYVEPCMSSLLRNGSSIFIGASLVRKELVERVRYFDLRYALSAVCAFTVLAVKHGVPLHPHEPALMLRADASPQIKNSHWRMWREALAVSEEP